MKLRIDHWFKPDVTAIRQAALDVLTQSEIMLRASCARKWFYRYALRLDRRGMVDFNLIYGSLIHRLLEELYRDKNAFSFTPEAVPIEITEQMVKEITKDLLLTPDGLEELELTKAKVQIAFDAYRRQHYKLDAKLQIKDVEKVIRLDWGGLQLAAKLDMVAKPKQSDGVFIWDFKSAGQMNKQAMDAWTFRFQFLFYCWIYWKVTGIRPQGLMINGLLKTGLRPKIVDRKTKRREDREEYLKRVRQDMIDHREDYFFRQRIPLPNGMLERFEYEMLSPHVDAFRMMQRKASTTEAMNALAMAPNTNQCHMYNSYCEFLSLCKDGTVALSEFDYRDSKHMELET